MYLKVVSSRNTNLCCVRDVIAAMLDGDGTYSLNSQSFIYLSNMGIDSWSLSVHRELERVHYC